MPDETFPQRGAPAGLAPPGPVLGVGIVGHGFMGDAHSQAWRTAGHVFDLPLRPVMAALCGRDGAAAATAAARHGWAAVETDWRSLIARDDVHLVDVCTPGDRHAEIAIAALRAGKHVLCEKPLANSVAQAQAMAQAAAQARDQGVRSMVGFNYRRVPALALARRLIADGRIGQLRHVRAAYLQDWLADPAAPLTWRLQRERAGSGALSDLGSHIVDIAEYLSGDRLAGVSGISRTFVTERPLPAEPGQEPRTGPVTVDDAVVFVARFASGAAASFEATRCATGRKNALRIELNGDRGSIAFDLERLNELEVYEPARDDDTAGFRRVLVTEPSHPYLSAWWPPGHILGWEHTFTHQVRDLVVAIAEDADPEPSFDDGLRVQRILEAVAESADNQTRWTAVD
jgi:predicted dehydrogenase